MSATITVTEPRPKQITVVIEANPPVPLFRNGQPDVGSPLFTGEHSAAIACALHLAELSGNPVDWRHLFKP